MPSAARTVRLGLAVAVLAVAAWLFWPATLGGSATYVTTHGISMQPRFSTGDLAILRTADHYSVGDVVAYRSADLDTTVMHRLVAESGGRFTVKGDNNDFLDPDHPAQQDILGSLWLRVPQGGRWLSALHSPKGIALLALAVPAALWPWRRRGRHSGRRGGQPGGRRGVRRDGRRGGGRPAAGSGRSLSVRPASLPARARARQLATACGAVVLVAALAEGVLLVLPATESDAETVMITQQGAYSYAGSATVGTTYPSGSVRTGDPLYTHLISGLAVTFRDDFSGPGLSAVTGTLALDVAVATDDGWSAPLVSGPEAPVRDRTAVASVPLDPAAANALLQRHFTEVGVASGGATVVVTPRLTVTGTVQGQAFTAGKVPALSFAVDPTALRPAGSGSTALSPAAGTAVAVSRVTGRRLTVSSVSVPIGTAREVVALVLVAALAGLLGGAAVGRRGPRSDAEEFRLRHAGRILAVRGFSPGSVVIDVQDGAALARVAERLDALLLHSSGPDGDVFAVQDGETTYRFLIPAEDAPGERPRLVAVPTADRVA